MKISFQALRAFIELAETGSFTKAAQNLYITQPAVSKSIRELESLFDLKLIDRSHAPIQLTEHGEALLKQGKPIFNIEKALLLDFSLRAQAKVGNLAIGASTTVASHWLTPYLSDFSKNHPSVDISMISGNSTQIVEALTRCEIDVGIIEGPIEGGSEIEVLEWRRENLVLVCAIDYVINDEDSALSKQKWVLREDGSGTARVTEEFFTENRIAPVNHIKVGNNLAALDMVCNGVGVALLPEIMVKPYLDSGKLKRLDFPKMDSTVDRPLNWITLSWRTETPLRRAFFELVFKRVSKLER